MTFLVLLLHPSIQYPTLHIALYKPQKKAAQSYFCSFQLLRISLTACNSSPASREQDTAQGWILLASCQANVVMEQNRSKPVFVTKQE